MIDFFQSKFQQVHYLNLRWIRFLIDDQIDLSPEIKLSVSQLINSRHLWLANLCAREPESDLNDIHLERYWIQLETANFTEWDNFFMNLRAGNELENSENKERNHPSWIDLTFQALQDNAYFLGQLELNCRKTALELPDFQLIPLI